MAAHVLADLDGKIDWILDAGSSRHGLKSTIVACLETPALLRPGAITREAIEAVLGGPLESPVVDGRRRAPQGGWNRITRRAPVCGSRRPGPHDEAGARFCRGSCGRRVSRRGSTFHPPGTSSRRRRDLFAHLRARRLGGADHRGGPHSSSGSGGRHQRQASAGGGPARRLTAPSFGQNGLVGRACELPR